MNEKDTRKTGKKKDPKAYEEPKVEKKDNLKEITLLSFTPPAP